MAFSIQTGKVTNFTASISTGWYTVTFDIPFPADVVPLVFAQTQTRNGQDTPGLRLRNISNTSFQVRMDELIMDGAESTTKGDLGYFTSNKQDHPNAETLGWAATALG